MPFRLRANEIEKHRAEFRVRLSLPLEPALAKETPYLGKPLRSDLTPFSGDGLLLIEQMPPSQRSFCAIDSILIAYIAFLVLVHSLKRISQHSTTGVLCKVASKEPYEHLVGEIIWKRFDRFVQLDPSPR